MAEASLYEQDFALWAERQAAAIREAALSSANLPLDWDNLAEEIESLGRSQGRELRSRIDTIIEHLLKLDYSPAVDPRDGWLDTIGRERREIELVLDDSPSLRSRVPEIVDASSRRTARLVGEMLERRGEIDRALRQRLEGVRYEIHQVLGGWLPDDPLRRDRR